MPRRGLDAGRVVDAAVVIADTDGLEALTLAGLAAKLGVRAPSLYNHVDGRDGLLRGVTLRGLRELTDALRDAAVGRSGADALAAVAHAYRAFAHEHPGLYAATVAAPARDDAEHLAAAGETLGVVLAALRAWNLDGDDQVHSARTVRSALHGFIVLEAAGGFGMPVDPDASFDELVATLARGLG